MRRILRIVATGGSIDEMGDISTLADPHVVQTLVEHRQNLKSVKS